MNNLQLRTGFGPRFTPEEFFAGACAALLGMEPDYCRDIGGSFQFTLSGAHGGVWHLSLSELQVRQGRWPADLELEATANDFVALLGAELDGRTAVESGRLRVHGEPVCLVKLARFLEPFSRAK